MLIASLAMIVALSSSASLVARLNDRPEKEALRRAGRPDYANPKPKVAIAIPSIRPLQVFLKVEGHRRRGVVWRTGIHVLCELGALMLRLPDRITRHGKAKENGSA